MELTNIVPIMTSNITPNPYTVSASTVFNSSYDAYMAFNGNSTDSENGWLCQVNNETKEEHIQVYFGKLMEVHKFAICSRSISPTFHPVRFKLSVSTNGIDWNDVFTTLDDQIFGIHEEKTYILDKAYECKYARLTILKHYPLTSGAIRTFIAELNIIGREVMGKSLSIHKTLSSNIPMNITKGSNEVHFTEKGQIFINDKDGKMIPCNTGDIIKEISNPLTLEPLECLQSFSTISQNIQINTILPLNSTSGNVEIVDNKFKLKAGKMYEISLNANGAFSDTTSQMNIGIYDTSENKVIEKSLIALIPMTATYTNTVQSTYTNTIICPVVDTEYYITIPYNVKGTYISFGLVIKEIRNNPINQYGGFETEVLFDGSASGISEYQLSDNVNNYDFLCIKIDKGVSSNNIKYSLPPATSDTTPIPLIITYSSLYSGYSGWGVFNQQTSTTYDCWCSNGADGWLKIDTGVNTKAIGCYLGGRTYDTNTIKNWIIEGSNDDSVWEKIISNANPVPQTKTYYSFGKVVNYRYYRITGIATNGSNIILGNFDLISEVTKQIRTEFFTTEKEVKLLESEVTKILFNDDKMQIISIKSPIDKVIGIKGQLPSLLSGGTF